MANSNNSPDPVYSYLKAFVLLLVYLASLYEVQAQVHLVKDLNTDPQSSQWGNPIQMGNTFYFGAFTNQYGTELWKTDGTAAGTVMVKDINPGRVDSAPQRMTVSNGILYFIADDGVHGTELWRSDGTANGTYLFRESEEGGDASVVLEMVSANDYLFFTIVKNDVYHLWKTNGTEITLVKDLNYVVNLTVVGDAVYFTGSGPDDQAELWRTEGTGESTNVVKDLNGPIISSSPGNLTNVNGTLYFTAYTTDKGIELWKTNGTDPGTVMVADIAPNAAHSRPEKLTATDSRLYFTADDGVKGRELWVTDGTSTHIVKDISLNGASTQFGETIGINGSIYFTAMNQFGLELWTSGGTINDTNLVLDIEPGVGSSNPSNFKLANGKLFFSAWQELTGTELWMTDGTFAGTVITKDLYEGMEGSFPAQLFTIGSDLYFWGNDGTHGIELWVTKASGETKLVKDIATGTDYSSITSLVVENNTAWFIDYNTGIWRTDGTEANTLNIREQMNQQYKHLLKTDKALYVVVHVPEFNIDKILFSDGTEEMIALHYFDFNSISWLKEVNGVLYIAGDRDGFGMELWKSNGVFNDVTLVRDINPGAGGSFPAGPIVENGVLYFRANDGQNGTELWRSEGGTALGTKMVKDIYAGPSNSNPQELVAINGKIYYNAVDSQHGQEFWVSDGTESGTHMVADIWEGTNWGNPLGFVSLNDVVYFFARDEESGFELFRSDGTAEGTHIVKDINPGNGSFDSPDYLTVFNGQLYFSASDGEHGIELWKSDGTAEGTHMLKDITPGAQGSILYWFTVINNHLFFIENGRVWRTNGTECSTVAVLENTGVEYYDDFMPVGFGNKMYFEGVGADNGAELYYYDFSTINDPGCTQTIAFGEIEPKLPIDPPFDLQATATSGLTVTFESSDNNIATISGNKVTIHTPGEVTITATQTGNSEYKSATPVTQLLTVKLITGLEGENVDKLISVYPNPTTDYINVDGSVLRDGALLNIMDINGNILGATEDSLKLDVSNLPNGIYIVRITTKEFSVAKRIIKK